MTDNVIILTGGLSGSSVLAGLLASAGYWTGPETFKKRDYNTHENSELIALNRRLMSQAGVGEDYTKQFPLAAIDRIAGLVSADEPDCRDLIRRCNERSPWVWKDPRLSLTIRFWDRLLPGEGVRFLLLDRELLQAWISLTQRRMIQTWKNTRRYHDDVYGSLRAYLGDSGRPFMAITYEDLILRPELEIARLSTFLGVTISMQHLTSTYRGQLYKKNGGLRDFVKASLIYLKNYRQRLR